MGQIHVVTDSGSDLPVKLREELGIQVVPLTVRFGDEVFKDGVDLTAAEFYARLKQETRMPSTSQPSPRSSWKCMNASPSPAIPSSPST